MGYLVVDHQRNFQLCLTGHSVHMQNPMGAHSLSSYLEHAVLVLIDIVKRSTRQCTHKPRNWHRWLGRTCGEAHAHRFPMCSRWPSSTTRRLCQMALERYAADTAAGGGTKVAVTTVVGVTPQSVTNNKIKVKLSWKKKTKANESSALATFR